MIHGILEGVGRGFPFGIGAFKGLAAFSGHTVLPHVAVNGQVTFLFEHLFVCDDHGEIFQGLETAIGLENLLDMAVFEIAHVFILPDLFDGIDDEYLFLFLRRLAGAGDQEAGFHGRVVEEVGSKPDHTFDQILFDQFSAHIRFRIAEEHAVRPEGDGAAVVGIEALLDVLLEGIVGAALRGRAPGCGRRDRSRRFCDPTI